MPPFIDTCYRWQSISYIVSNSYLTQAIAHSFFGELALVQIIEVRVLHGHATWYPFVRFKSHHACEQIEAVLVQILRVLWQRDALPLGESGLEVGQLERCRPVRLVGSPLNLEYLEDLVYLWITCEEGLSLGHLSEDATNRPNVYWRRILLLT